MTRIQPSVFWGDNGRFHRWAGYTLGYDIVGRYLAAHHVRATAVVDVKAMTILAGFRGPSEEGRGRGSHSRLRDCSGMTPEDRQDQPRDTDWHNAHAKVAATAAPTST